MPASLTDVATSSIISYTGPLSVISNADLDDIIQMLQDHYSKAGITMLDGFLCALGYHIPRSHICESLLCIDPVQWVFERIHFSAGFT